MGFFVKMLLRTLKIVGYGVKLYDYKPSERMINALYQMYRRIFEVYRRILAIYRRILQYIGESTKNARKVPF